MLFPVLPTCMGVEELPKAGILKRRHYCVLHSGFHDSLARPSCLTCTDSECVFVAPRGYIKNS